MRTKKTIKGFTFIAVIILIFTAIIYAENSTGDTPINETFNDSIPIPVDYSNYIPYFEGPLYDNSYNIQAVTNAPIKADESLVGHWKMDNISDSSGNENNLLNNAGTSTTSTGCHENICYDFDGVNDNLTSNSNLDSLNNVFSLSMWLDIDTDGNYQIISSIPTSDNHQIVIWRRNDNKIWFEVTGATTTRLQTTSTFTNADGMKHFVFVKNGIGASNYKIYINGVLAQTTTLYDTYTGSGNMNKIYLGTDNYVSPYWFNGKMDEIALFDKALNADEVTDLYNHGITYESNPKLSGLKTHYSFDSGLSDDSLNTYDLIDSGTSQITAKFGNGREFNSAGDKMNFSTFPGTRSLTVATWFKRDGNSRYEPLIVKGGSGSPGNDIDYQLQISSTNFPIFEIGNGVSTKNTLAGTTSITDNNWHYLAATVDDDTNEIKIYLDGTQVGSMTKTVDMQTTSDILNLGVWQVNQTTYYADGIMDETSIWSRALKPAEISELYNSGSGKLYPYDTSITPTLAKTDALLIIDEVFMANLTNPAIWNNSNTYISYLNGTIKETTFDRLIEYNNKRYLVNYGNSSYDNISSIRKTINVIQITLCDETSLRTQLNSFISNSLN